MRYTALVFMMLIGVSYAGDWDSVKPEGLEYERCRTAAYITAHQYLKVEDLVRSGEVQQIIYGNQGHETLNSKYFRENCTGEVQD